MELYHSDVGFVAIPVSPPVECHLVVPGSPFFLCASIRESRLRAIAEPSEQDWLGHPGSVRDTSLLGLL